MTNIYYSYSDTSLDDIKYKNLRHKGTQAILRKQDIYFFDYYNMV